MKILGIDPGGTTGWAVARVSDDRDSFTWIAISDPFGVKYKDFNPWLKQTLPKVDLVICEDYVLNPKVKKWDGARNMANNLYTKALVGRVEYACWESGKRLILQEAKVKPFAFQLNKIPYPNKPKDPMRHYYDAKAHIRHYLRSELNI